MCIRDSAQAEARGDGGRGERPVGAGVPGEQVPQRVLDRLGERLGDADGQRRAQRVPQPARVLDRRPVVRAADPHPDGAPGCGELVRPGRLRPALGQLVLRQRAQQAQQVGHRFGILGPAVLGEPLELPLQLLQDLRVEEFAQLRLAEQLGQQPGVQRQCGRPALGQGRVALVEELGDVPEEEGTGEGGGLRGGDLDQPYPARLDVAHQLGQARHVEDVLQAFADGFQHDREGAEFRGHLQQLGGALTLLPQRGALARTAPRQQQGAGRALAEAGGEESGAADLVGDDLVDVTVVEGDVGRAQRGLFVVELERLGSRRVVVQQVHGQQVGVREAEHDAVVGVHHLRVHAVLLGEAGAQRERPRGVHLRAERGVDHDPPVAELVAEALHHDGPVVRDVAAGLALLGEVRQHVLRGPGVQAGRQQPQPRVLVGQAAELAEERADRAAQFERPAELVALPERQPARHPGGGSDQDPVAGDVLDPPRGGAQGEDVPDP